MVDSKVYDEFLLKFDPDVSHIGFDGGELKSDGVFKKYTVGDSPSYSVLLKDKNMCEFVLADIYSSGSRFFELQCLLAEVRRKGRVKDVTTEADDCYSQDDYKNAISLLVDPILNESDFNKRVELANSLIPHHSNILYEELISLDGKFSLSGAEYGGGNVIVKDNDSWRLAFQERGSLNLEIVFFKQQYLFEYLLESVIHII